MNRQSERHSAGPDISQAGPRTEVATTSAVDAETELSQKQSVNSGLA